MKECIFCEIANSDDPSKLVWQNDVAAAFKTNTPAAPVHILLVPKKHIESLDHLVEPELAGMLLMATREVAHTLGLKGAWRLRTNNGAKAGQTIQHLHFHILGGIQMAE